MNKQPLEGIRIIDMSVIWAAPYATALLGHLGAEVIHVDNPHHRPDFFRMFTMWPLPPMLSAETGRAQYPDHKVGARPWNRHAMANRYSWNRLSCCIDIDKPEGKEVFKKLIKNSDVFIENNSATAMEHLGLDHKTLMEVNPQLICINMPAYGRNGPYMNYVGWGALHEALTGHDWLRGYNDDEHPIHNTFRFQMDDTAAFAVFGVITGLIHRKRTGKGQWMDVAQIQTTMHCFGEIYMDAAWNGRVQRTLGNRHRSAAQGCYRCKGEDAWVNITINTDEEWQGFCRAIENPALAGDERFEDVISRYRNHDQLDAVISEWTILKDKFEVFHLLQMHGVPAGPVENWKDTYADPQLNARDFFQTITQKDCGTHRYPGWPWKLSETPCRVNHPPCMLGEDNDYVYKEVIGMNDKEIAKLTEQNVIGDLEYEWAGPRPEHLTYDLQHGIGNSSWLVDLYCFK